MKLIFTISILILYGNLFAYAQRDSKEVRLMRLMEESVKKEGKQPVHSFLLYVNNSKTGFSFNKGIGTTQKDDINVDSSFQFKTASITKTIVATIVLQLHEEGKLNIYEGIKNYLSPIDFIRFDELHIYNGKKYQDSITIEMLLNHTSGIADIFTDAESRFNLSVFFHPKRQYTADRIYKKYFKYKLNKKPFNIPGEGYHYSDINYMLLGFLIEQIEQQTLPEVLRKRILEPLNMQNTYFEYYEKERGTGKMIDALINKINISKRVNTSYEWAGGGIVSTVEDMAKFIEALFDLRFFNKKESLDRMMDVSKTSEFGASYGLGLYKYEFDNKVFFGHGGFYGSILAYCPMEKLTISATIGQSNPPFNTVKVIDEIIRIAVEE